MLVHHRDRRDSGNVKMTNKEKAKKLHEIACALEEWGKYKEKVTNAAEWDTPEAKQIIRKAMTLLVYNLALLNECKNKYGCFNPLTQCFMAIEQAASWPKTKDLGDCRAWTHDFTKIHLWGGEKRSLADECIRYANEVNSETEQATKNELGEMSKWYQTNTFKFVVIPLLGIIVMAIVGIPAWISIIRKADQNSIVDTNIFAYVSKDGTILRSNNFPWEIKKSKNKDGNILYTIVDRKGDPTAITVVPDNSINQYFVHDSWDGLVIEFTCAEEKISDFTIKLKY